MFVLHTKTKQKNCEKVDEGLNFSYAYIKNGRMYVVSETGERENIY